MNIPSASIPNKNTANESRPKPPLSALDDPPSDLRPELLSILSTGFNGVLQESGYYPGCVQELQAEISNLRSENAQLFSQRQKDQKELSLLHNEVAIMGQLLRQYESRVQTIQYVPTQAGRPPAPVGTGVSGGTMQPPPQNGNFRNAAPVSHTAQHSMTQSWPQAQPHALPHPQAHPYLQTQPPPHPQTRPHTHPHIHPHAYPQTHFQAQPHPQPHHPQTQALPEQPLFRDPPPGPLAYQRAPSESVLENVPPLRRASLPVMQQVVSVHSANVGINTGHRVVYSAQTSPVGTPVLTTSHHPYPPQLQAHSVLRSQPGSPTDTQLSQQLHARLQPFNQTEVIDLTGNEEVPRKRRRLPDYQQLATQWRYQPYPSQPHIRAQSQPSPGNGSQQHHPPVHEVRTPDSQPSLPPTPIEQATSPVNPAPATRFPVNLPPATQTSPPPAAHPTSTSHSTSPPTNEQSRNQFSETDVVTICLKNAFEEAEYKGKVLCRMCKCRYEMSDPSQPKISPPTPFEARDIQVLVAHCKVQHPSGWEDLRSSVLQSLGSTSS